jgi:hypothetical protein
MDQNMNGDTAAILTALSDARNELTKSIGDLHSEFSKFQGGIEERVKTVEENQDKADTRQWYHSVIVLAGSILHHDLGQWFKLKF